VVKINVLNASIKNTRFSTQALTKSGA